MHTKIARRSALIGLSTLALSACAPLGLLNKKKDSDLPDELPEGTTEEPLGDTRDLNSLDFKPSKNPDDDLSLFNFLADQEAPDALSGLPEDMDEAALERARNAALAQVTGKPDLSPASDWSPNPETERTEAISQRDIDRYKEVSGREQFAKVIKGKEYGGMQSDTYAEVLVWVVRWIGDPGDDQAPADRADAQPRDKYTQVASAFMEKVDGRWLVAGSNIDSKIYGVAADK